MQNTGSIDLVSRAKLGYGFLVNNLDHRYGYLPTFATILNQDNLVARHDFPDFGDLTSRHLEATYMVQQMAGSTVDGKLLRALEDLFISYFRHQDGLSYRPPISQPFLSEISQGPYRAEVAEGFDQSRVMLTLVSWFRLTGDTRAKQRMDKLVEGIRTKAVQKDNLLYFTQVAFPPGFTPLPGEKPYNQQLYFAGTQILPLVTWYELTGSELALDTAKRLYRFITRDFFYFGADGSFQALDIVPPGSWDQINGHTHSRLGTIAGILKYGNVLGEPEALAFGKRSFDWFYKNYCLSTGWCPEFLGRFPIEKEGCETCTLMDLILSCVELCAAGHDDYWSIVERIVRNQLVEQQITDTSFFKSSGRPRGNVFQEYAIEPEELLGAFGGWCGVNDFIGNTPYSWRLMNCCAPSGIKALYTAWDNAIRWKEGKLQINLLLSRHSEYADMTSFDPAAGRVEISVKQNCGLKIRMPEWVEKEKVRLSVNGNSQHFNWNGLYLEAGSIDRNANVAVTYPLRKINTTEKTGPNEYTMNWIGDTVMSVSPPGKHLPLYQR